MIEVKVRWPSGKVDSLKDLAANQRLFVQEGKGLIKTTRTAHGETLMK